MNRAPRHEWVDGMDGLWWLLQAYRRAKSYGSIHTASRRRDALAAIAKIKGQA
jgi:hypothetical protein